TVTVMPPPMTTFSPGCLLRTSMASLLEAGTESNWSSRRLRFFRQSPCQDRPPLRACGNGLVVDTHASAVSGIGIGASPEQGFESAGASASPQLAVHVQGDALLPVALGPDAIDGLLRLAVAPVAPLHRVAGRAQQLVVQGRQRLLQRRAGKLPQRPAQALEPPHPPPQLLQPPQRRLGLAAPVEQPIHLVHDLPQHPQLRLPARQLPQPLLLGRAEAALHEQVAVLEQLRHAPLQPPGLPGPRLRLLVLAGPAARLLGDLVLDLLAEPGQ